MLTKMYKYRLSPTKKQCATLQWTLDRNRELYHAALQERRDAWNVCKQHPNYYHLEWREEQAKVYSVSCYDQIKQLPDLKQDREEYKEIHSQVTQDTIRRVEKAFKAFFRRVKSGEAPGYPRFQGKDRYNSFTYPQGGFGVEKRGDTKHVLILSKIGHIKMKLHRPLQGAMKTCTLKREGEHWYVCIACELEAQPKLPYTDEAIGIDLGLLHFATTSTGDTIENPRHYRCAEKKIASLQQAVARKQKGSHRRKKAIKRVSTAYRKVRNQRNDFLHKQSRWLVDAYETIVFEELTPSKMSRAPKPKQDEQGNYLPNGASAKGGLNKSIMDAGWSQFVAYCSYKAENAGTTVATVDPDSTSQICSACGKKGPHLDLSVRTYVCIHCGNVRDRDHNAAINILNRWVGSTPQPASAN